METKEKATRRLRPLLPLLPPVLLSLLFYLFRGRQALMDGWVIHVMGTGGAASGPPVCPAPLLPGGGAGHGLSHRLRSLPHPRHGAGRPGSTLRMSWAGGWSACSVPCFGYGPATAGFGLRATTPPPSQKRAVWRPGPTPCPPWLRSRCTLPARPQTSPPRWSETVRATSLRIWTTVSAGESPSMRSWSRSSPVWLCLP